MKKRKVIKKTYMSWYEQEYVGRGRRRNIRAVALCDDEGYFYAAINAMRDGSMGEKDENGVYERLWYADYISNGVVRDVREATLKEVELYRHYWSLESELEACEEELVSTGMTDDGGYCVYVRARRKAWWRRIVDFFSRDRYPF